MYFENLLLVGIHIEINSLLEEEDLDPYETLKNLTRTNEKVNKESIRNFIETLNVSQSIKDELRSLSPQNYTGI